MLIFVHYFNFVESLPEYCSAKKEKMNKTFKQLCKLSCNFDRPLIETMPTTLIIALIKCTTIFGNTSKCTKIEDILKNDDMLFVGSLLIRLLKIQIINGHLVSNLFNFILHHVKTIFFNFI